MQSRSVPPPRRNRPLRGARFVIVRPFDLRERRRRRRGCRVGRRRIACAPTAIEHAAFLAQAVAPTAARRPSPSRAMSANPVRCMSMRWALVWGRRHRPPANAAAGSMLGEMTAICLPRYRTPPRSIAPQAHEPVAGSDELGMPSPPALIEIEKPWWHRRAQGARNRWAWQTRCARGQNRSAALSSGSCRPPLRQLPRYAWPICAGSCSPTSRPICFQPNRLLPLVAMIAANRESRRGR